MRAIGLSLILAFAAAAGTHDDIVDLFASMAGALSEDNPPGFLKSCDRAMPGYEELRGKLNALVQQAELASSLEIPKDDGDDSKREVDVDWYLEIRNRQPAAPLVRRRETVHCQLEKQKKHWRVVSLAPQTLFDPPKF